MLIQLTLFEAIFAYRVPYSNSWSGGYGGRWPQQTYYQQPQQQLGPYYQQPWQQQQYPQQFPQQYPQQQQYPPQQYPIYEPPGYPQRYPGPFNPNVSSSTVKSICVI